VLVRGLLPNPDRKLRPGYYAKVRIPASEEYDALLVSELAIGTDQDQKYVLVVDEKNVAQRRRVALGRLQDDGLRVILSGVEEKDSVIVNGMQRARVGAAVAPQKVEMPTRKAPAQPTAPVATSEQPKAAGPGAAETPKTKAE
jgi:multidrug efflux pump subunit AcrA (membrane-fusion protein)